jgi:flagellar basal-body rod protein FlgC
MTDVQAIIKTGMAYERMRIEAAAQNIARANTVAGSAAEVAPLFVVSLDALQGSLQPEQVQLLSQQRVRTVHQPDHPLADAQGLIYQPDLDLAGEMITLSSAKRAYEANIKVYNSLKDINAKALEIGK